MKKARTLIVMIAVATAVLIADTISPSGGEVSVRSSQEVATSDLPPRALRSRETTTTEPPTTTTTSTTTTAPPTTTTTTPPPPPPTVAPTTTQAPARSGSGSPEDPASWDRLAQCESGGNWAINTGNGYYGGIQFSLSSWRAVGGTGYPHEHSRETQIEMGKRLYYSGGGWNHWPGCTRRFGWR